MESTKPTSTTNTSFESIKVELKSSITKEEDKENIITMMIKKFVTNNIYKIIDDIASEQAHVSAGFLKVLDSRYFNICTPERVAVGILRSLKFHVSSDYKILPRGWSVHDLNISYYIRNDELNIILALPTGYEIRLTSSYCGEVDELQSITKDEFPVFEWIRNTYASILITKMVTAYKNAIAEMAQRYGELAERERSLRDKVEQLGKENDELKKEVEELRRQNMVLRQQNSRLNEIVKKIEEIAIKEELEQEEEMEEEEEEELEQEEEAQGS